MEEPVVDVEEVHHHLAEGHRHTPMEASVVVVMLAAPEVVTIMAIVSPMEDLAAAMGGITAAAVVTLIVPVVTGIRHHLGAL